MIVLKKTIRYDDSAQQQSDKSEKIITFFSFFFLLLPMNNLKKKKSGSTVVFGCFRLRYYVSTFECYNTEYVIDIFQIMNVNINGLTGRIAFNSIFYTHRFYCFSSYNFVYTPTVYAVNVSKPMPIEPGTIKGKNAISIEYTADFEAKLRPGIIPDGKVNCVSYEQCRDADK